MANRIGKDICDKERGEDKWNHGYLKEIMFVKREMNKKMSH